MTKKDLRILYGGVIGVLIAVIILIFFNHINVAQGVQILLTFTLVCVTAVYVRRTAEIAGATKEQANASLKMVGEMREQRIIESRPIIIQKSVVETETEFRSFGSKDWFSYFEIYNAGNGPAIELEISLMNNDKTPLHSQRKSYLRTGDTPIKFELKELSEFEESTFYLISEYKSIISTTHQPTWYQTWLPFKTSKASEGGRIYIIPGELEFREVTEKDRIDVFSSRSKPK